MLKRKRGRERTLGLTCEHSILEEGTKQVSSQVIARWWSSTQCQTPASLCLGHAYLAGYVEICCAWGEEGLTWKLHSGTPEAQVHLSFRIVCWCHCWKVAITPVSLHFSPLRCWSEITVACLWGLWTRCWAPTQFHSATYWKFARLLSSQKGHHKFRWQSKRILPTLNIILFNIHTLGQELNFYLFVRFTSLKISNCLIETDFYEHDFFTFRHRKVYLTHM